MNEFVRAMKDRMHEFAVRAKAKEISKENFDTYVDPIILAAAEIYKDPAIELLIPTDTDGTILMYTDDTGVFLPMYTDEKEVRSSSPKSYISVSFKEACDQIYENLATYELLDSTEYILSHLHELNELKEYADHNPRIAGIMIDPDSPDLFGLEGWILKGVVFKGMGVDTVTMYDSNTGEIQKRL